MIWKSRLGAPVCMSLALGVEARECERRRSVSSSGSCFEREMRLPPFWMLPWETSCSAACSSAYTVTFCMCTCTKQLCASETFCRRGGVGRWGARGGEGWFDWGRWGHKRGWDQGLWGRVVYLRHALNLHNACKHLFSLHQCARGGGGGEAGQGWGQRQTGRQ